MDPIIQLEGGFAEKVSRLELDARNKREQNRDRGNT